jgi:methylmalonyl-CoA mutase N-terminal domain/subunit
MIISSFIPGASYSAGVFTIPWTALNAATSVDTSPIDSAERFLQNLLTVLHERNTANTLTQPTFSAEVASTSLSVGTWETSTSNFSDRLIQSFLVCFDAGASLTPLLVDGDTITNA